MRYSKQRDLILTYVQNSTHHPTADVVYRKIQMAIPNVSLGTIYRNLNQLCEMNLIKKISVPDKPDRFDRLYQDHCHIYCNTCGKVEDIGKELFEKVYDAISSKTDYTILSHDMVFVGICHDCLKGKRR